MPPQNETDRREEGTVTFGQNKLVKMLRADYQNKNVISTCYSTSGTVLWCTGHKAWDLSVELEAIISILYVCEAFGGNGMYMVCVDQMAWLYSLKGGTRSWPVAEFYNMLDLATFNTRVIHALLEHHAQERLLQGCSKDSKHVVARAKLRTAPGEETTPGEPKTPMSPNTCNVFVGSVPNK
jgi:hypothetical protein